MQKMTRRGFLRTSAGAAAAAMLASTGVSKLLAQGAELPTLVTSIRTLANPYHNTWNLGARFFAASVGAEHVTLLQEGNSEKSIADIKAMLARTGGKMVLDVDPNDSPDCRPIVEACKEAGAFVVTQWNKPDDLHPWDFDPNYVCHISFNGVTSGKDTALALFNTFDNKGGIVGLGGIPANVPAIQRRAGLDEALAENPDVELLDWQIANWSETEAFDKVAAWITRFGDEIKGIWAANDNMAMGALEALRQEGLAGTVLVSGVDGTKLAIEGILNGEVAATVGSDPFWQGGMSLSIGLKAAMGEFDPATEPKEHREFYGTGILVTSENAQEFYDKNILDVPVIDWDDIWGRVTGQIVYE
ncbi:MAG: sugar ABC transporter substrate-binding protein [Anaerolineae bacterium]|nr:sugar ABC transporter substrate-binding protein [Anaerolineae bacterium]